MFEFSTKFVLTLVSRRGYMGHDGPCIFGRSGRCHHDIPGCWLLVVPMSSWGPGIRGIRGIRNEGVPWDLVSKSCFPRNVYLYYIIYDTILYYIIYYTIYIYKSCSNVWCGACNDFADRNIGSYLYVADFSVQLEYREAQRGSEMLNEWSTWMIFTQQSWSPWSTYPLVN